MADPGAVRAGTRDEMEPAGVGAHPGLDPRVAVTTSNAADAAAAQARSSAA